MIECAGRCVPMWASRCGPTARFGQRCVAAFAGPTTAGNTRRQHTASAHSVGTHTHGTRVQHTSTPSHMCAYTPAHPPAALPAPQPRSHRTPLRGRRRCAHTRAAGGTELGVARCFVVWHARLAQVSPLPTPLLSQLLPICQVNAAGLASCACRAASHMLCCAHHGDGQLADHGHVHRHIVALIHALSLQPVGLRGEGDNVSLAGQLEALLVCVVCVGWGVGVRLRPGLAARHIE